MTETRDFPTAVVASISSGYLLCNFSDMHEAAEFILGHPVWTHHFGNEGICSALRAAVLEQCPSLPKKEDCASITKENWQEFVASLEADIGPVVRLRKGSGETAMSPFDGIPEDKPAIVVIGEERAQ